MFCYACVDTRAGIYPREPRNKKKVSKGSTPSTTFYYTKDIQYLLHEPLLDKFRDHKALAKKIARALGRGEVGDAARLEKTQTPRITLDHIIKERYPTFVDALRDLDDALSMLFLFANLPSTSAVPPKMIALCQRLCLEFEHYLIVTHSLRKSFLSIKGVYYQATIQGQDILWLVPYKFVQRVTGDVDFRIMGTFIEFYTTLLGFVNFRLYTSIGLVYPPKFSQSSDDKGGELGAFTLEGRNLDTSRRATGGGLNGEAAPRTISAVAQAEADKLAQLPQTEADDAVTTADSGAETDNDAIDTFEPAAEDADILPQPQTSNDSAAKLFAPFTFYLSREIPRQPLEFLLKAFGCKRVGWDSVLGDGAYTTNEADPSITHQLVDRPNLPLPAQPDVSPDITDGGLRTLKPGTRVPGRTYIQPQWVWDCVNQGKLLRPDLYAPGATLPPHLSPWVKPKKGQYDPTAPLAEQEREGEAEEAEAIDEGEAEDGHDEPHVTVKENSGVLVGRADEVEAGEGMDIAGTESDESDKDDADGATNQDAEEFGGFSDAEQEEVSDDEASLQQHQRELEAEAAGLPFSSADAGRTPARALKAKNEEVRKKVARKRREAEEELERSKMMLSRKKRKLLDKMLYSNRQAELEAEKLRGKRRKIEKGKAAGKVP